MQAHQLTLRGRLSYTDDRGRLVFTTPADNTSNYETLSECMPALAGYRRPYSKYTFTVTPKAGQPLSPADIAEYTGKLLYIRVYPQQYNFTAKYGPDAGQKITGATLVLLDIQKCGE